MGFKKIVFSMIITLFLIFLVSIPNNCHAISWQDIDEQARGFISSGESQQGNGNTEKQIQEIVVPIAQILVVVGDIIVVIAMAVIGIKYMVASPESKAKLKTQLVGVVMATAVIFGAQIIWRVIYQILSNF